jgi:RHS repeat-associated protein
MGWEPEESGGGGGHATVGKSGGSTWNTGVGGSVIYGNPQLSNLFMGSGGGRSNTDWYQIDHSRGRVEGGAGGGIVFIAAQTINFPGSVVADGQTKPVSANPDNVLRGGGGAGGSIRIEGNAITLGPVSASGGSPNDQYGSGGMGRIAIYYSNSLANSATICAQASTYCKNTSEISTPTPTQTVTPTAIPMGVGTYDDANAAWVYNGSWSTWSGAGPISNTMHYSNATGATASFTFQAPAKFILYFQATSNRSNIMVSVDGGTPIAVNAYNATNLWQQSYTSSVYTDTGSHTVTISTPGNGTYIDVDAIQIVEAPPAPAGWYSNTYTYSTDAPHAVDSVNRVNFTDTFDYDANGNMTCRTENGVTYKQDYNAENRISAIHKMDGDCDTGTAEDSWLYVYDGDGVRVSTAYFAGGSSTPDLTTRYYFGGALETSGSTVKKYYSFAGQTVAMKDDGVFKYFLSDHLGSTSVVLDANGGILEQQRYLPFGGPRTDLGSPLLTSTDFTYTGQRNLPDTGLMDYKARFYSPTLGRFIQPDTIIPGAENPQSCNRYSYSINNPVIYTDPSGHCFSGAVVDTVLCVASLAAAFFIFNGTSDSYQPNLSLQEIESRENSVQLGVAIYATVLSVKSPVIEALSNFYDCATGYCDPSLMMPGSVSAYDDSLTLYRGYNTNSVQALKSNAAKEGGYTYSQYLIDIGDVDQLMANHAKNSANPSSPYVSVTTDPRVAKFFAGDDGYVFELQIPKNRAIRNPHNNYVIPGGIPENEWLVPNYIKLSELRKISRLDKLK